MIKNIIQLLTISDFYGESELIDIAKGRYEIPKTYKEAIKQGIRKVKAIDNGRN
jgi:hypothetical protein